MSDNGAQVITVTIGGKTFRAGRRTAAHLLWTIARLKAKHPGTTLEVIQPCYNTGVAASAGTHDKDGVLDVRIVGLPWLAAQGFLRSSGWAAWWRHSGTWEAESMWHIHMVSLGCPGPLGIYVPGQIDDYYAHRDGLADHAHDPTWHPADIAKTVFDYPAWQAAQHPAKKKPRKPGKNVTAAHQAAVKGEGYATHHHQTIRAGLWVKVRALLKKLGAAK